MTIDLQWISDDRTLQKTSGAHVTISPLTKLTDVLVYSMFPGTGSWLRKSDCCLWVGQWQGSITGIHFAFYLKCAISWYLIGSPLHVEQCWSPTVFETMRRYSLTLSYGHILHLYSLTTSSLLKIIGFCSMLARQRSEHGWSGWGHP